MVCVFVGISLFSQVGMIFQVFCIINCIRNVFRLIVNDLLENVYSGSIGSVRKVVIMIVFLCLICFDSVL